jgi:hypothetical protein
MGQLSQLSSSKQSESSITLVTQQSRSIRMQHLKTYSKLNTPPKRLTAAAVLLQQHTEIHTSAALTERALCAHNTLVKTG